MKHFENVWREAEKISSEFYKENDPRQMPNNIKLEAEQIIAFIEANKCEMITESVGEILFYLARICKKYNINSWAALESITNDVKIDLYDEDS